MVTGSGSMAGRRRRRRHWMLLGVLAAAFGAASTLAAVADDRFITVASTTSTENSCLFRYLLPLFQQDTGIAVRVVAVGTGLALAQRGDAEVLWVHDKPSEEQFVAAGFGVARYDVMHNDFVLVGPRSMSGFSATCCRRRSSRAAAGSSWSPRHSMQTVRPRSSNASVQTVTRSTGSLGCGVATSWRRLRRRPPQTT
jgi:hypothetical protein